jgi:membrane protease YdiL (CAAX protease family)
MLGNEIYLMEEQQITEHTVEGQSLELTRREQLFEVGVFLFLIFPSMVFSFFAINQGNVSFVLTAIATILRDLALVSLILFFLWRNQESIHQIGWSIGNFWREFFLGIILFPFVFLGAGLLDQILNSIGLFTPSTPLPAALSAKGPGELILASCLVVIVALAEETIFRGYLILRFSRITNNLISAIILSALIFSIGHGYEGSAGVVTVAALGAVFAIIFVWRRSLVAPIVMHFLQDFIGIVLLPMLGLIK